MLKMHLYWKPHTTCWSREVKESQTGSLVHRHTIEDEVERTIFDEEHVHL